MKYIQCPADQSGEREIFTKQLCFQKVSSKVADNRENKLTNKSFSDYLICLIILKKSETFSWRETLSVWYPKRRKKMRENMRMSEGFWTDNKTLILDWAGVIITKRFLNLSSWPYSESPCIIKISYHCLSGLRTARLILDAFKIKSITWKKLVWAWNMLFPLKIFNHSKTWRVWADLPCTGFKIVAVAGMYCASIFSLSLHLGSRIGDAICSVTADINQI